MCEESSNSQMEMAQKLFQLQDERAHSFRLFEEGFKMYISSAPNYNFVKFRQLVNDVTKDFKRISSDIITVENEFRGRGLKSIADLIRLLQEEEDSRLQLCAKLQMAKQNAIDNSHIPEKWSEVAALKETYNKSIQKVSDTVESLRFETEFLE